MAILKAILNDCIYVVIDFTSTLTDECIFRDAQLQTIVIEKTRIVWEFAAVLFITFPVYGR